LFETELKFQVPAGQRAALRRAVGTASALTTRLQAVYADTEDRRLAAAGLALRLRKEGAVWVQTLKGRGDGLMQRLEHDVPLPGRRGTPALDARRHAGTPVGDRLLALLADGAALQPIYTTDIHRLHRQLRYGGALIELAYDRGHLFAGQRKAAVDEIEFELVRGPGAALVSLAQRWAARHGLWWDVRTKSERGHRLALGLDRVLATRAQPVALPDDCSPAQAFAQGVASSLTQALPNAAEIASGTGGPEHLHQLRVALRRLRSVLWVYAEWAPSPEQALALEADWRGPFRLLGAARDRDVIEQTLLPALAAVGAPPLSALSVGAGSPAPTGGVGDDPGSVVRGSAFNELLLRSLALCSVPVDADADGGPDAGPDASPDAGARLQAAAQARIDPLWRQVRRGAARFSEASVAQQHRLRKRLKRLRHALELVQPLLRRRSGSRLLRQIGRALQAMGELNDLQVAQALYRECTESEPPAWFAVGYLAARQQAAMVRAGRALSQLRQEQVAWRTLR